MSTVADILCFIATCVTPYNELYPVKCAFNLETLIYYWDIKLTNNINFQSLEIVRDTLQVTKNLN